MMPAFPDDLAISQRALGGDESARHQLAERMRCIGRIVGRLNSRLAHPLPHQDVEDLLQDIAAAVWRHLPQYNGEAPLEGYVRSFCELALNNALRRRARQPRVAPIEEIAAQPRVDESTELDALQHCLQRVEPESRTILRLKYRDGLTLEAIARTLGHSVNTVKSRYTRALQRLRSTLRPTSPNRP